MHKQKKKIDRTDDMIPVIKEIQAMEETIEEYIKKEYISER